MLWECTLIFKNVTYAYVYRDSYPTHYDARIASDVSPPIYPTCAKPDVVCTFALRFSSE